MQIFLPSSNTSRNQNPSSVSCTRHPFGFKVRQHNRALPTNSNQTHCTTQDSSPIYITVTQHLLLTFSSARHNWDRLLNSLLNINRLQGLKLHLATPYRVRFALFIQYTSSRPLYNEIKFVAITFSLDSSTEYHKNPLNNLGNKEGWWTDDILPTTCPQNTFCMQNAQRDKWVYHA